LIEIVVRLARVAHRQLLREHVTSRARVGSVNADGEGLGRAPPKTAATAPARVYVAQISMVLLPVTI
jgi:hypothetical protein